MLMRAAIVEYHDPSGVFPLIANDIAARLPLRNLNWHSPPRPLRQIKSLHVDFVPDKETKHRSAVSSAPPPVSERATSSLDIVRSGAGHDPRLSYRAPEKERRHQIPGLKTSAYLKIYILRCDDKAGYKDSEKKAIRAWIKENIPPEGKRENHDACEWLVLHVVLPDTIAASEPRWREVSTKDSDELKERPKSKSKWPGKGDRTVFDRLRADFNESGKSAQDRVAQIRVLKNQVPAELLPTPAVANTIAESAQERENAWADLITKFRNLILGPFDRRVRQYEADIAEQESRRSLPGWNFCTFFIHKEGLAKALESIGLVEDALAIYDELSLDLETVVRDMAAGTADGTATTFTPFTNDIVERITGNTKTSAKDADGDDDKANDMYDKCASLFEKDYREKIVRSDISIFDFVCYIFSRQKKLILRLANTQSARKELGADSHGKVGGEDLVLASEVCWRTSQFIHNTSRILRQDLAKAKHDGMEDRGATYIECLVCAWADAVAFQVLEETAAAALIEATRLEGLEQTQAGQVRSRKSTMSFAMGANPYPQRSSSLYTTRNSMPVELPRSMTSASYSQAGGTVSNTAASGGPAEVVRHGGIPGQAELATYRAELICIRRKMLENIARYYNFYAGWSFLEANASPPSVTNHDQLTGSHTDGYGHPLTSDTFSPHLAKVLSSLAAFQAEFEYLTDFALRHFLAATQNKSAERLMGDIAILKCQQEDFLLGAAYFERILPLYSADGWSLMEGKAITLYALCLKQLKRYELYITTILDLATKLYAKSAKFTSTDPSHSGQATAADALSPADMLRDAVHASENLEKEVSRPLQDFFEDVKVNRQILHSGKSDTWAIQLGLQSTHDSRLHFDELSVHLISVDDENLEIVARTEGPLEIDFGNNEIRVSSLTLAVGPYLVDRVTLRANKINLVQEFRFDKGLPVQDLTEATSTAPTNKHRPPPCIYLFPRRGAFSATARRSKQYNVTKTCHLDLVVQAGDSDVESLALKIKPATAGLRIHLADATALDIELRHVNGWSGVIPLGKLKAHHEAVVSVPYTMDQLARDIAFRFEILHDAFTNCAAFVGAARISNDLPLDVEVHDVFQIDTLFSSFALKPTGSVPLNILSARLDDSAAYSTEGPPRLPFPLPIFHAEPMDLIYKIARKPDLPKSLRRKDAALTLCVNYVAYDALAVRCIREQFAADLERSPFAAFEGLLVSVLEDRSKQLILTTDLDEAVLIGSVATASFDELSWSEIIPMVATEVRSELEQWLSKWHADNRSVPLDSVSAAAVAAQRVNISVDVPTMDMVFHASLRLVTPPKYNIPARPPVFVLGQPITARLRILHTEEWSAKKLFPNTPRVKIEGHDDQETQPWSFVCEIGVDTDETWLIAGKRRFHFQPQDAEDHGHEIALVPMKVGVLTMPNVDIHIQTRDGVAESVLSCETYCESAAQTVHIIRDERTTRAIIEEANSTATAAAPPSRPSTASVKEAS